MNFIMQAVTIATVAVLCLLVYSSLSNEKER
jgi:hypothetical protein